ncbi:hypothetical protein [Methylocaldum sp.]|uniref:hypothetical protein n=1 Tax=Methylocaldum sp. TaxID=1969727 RepID=UPI002D258B7F|nr:hypothetical protein [Methylocaldum sp.]HYE38157.1 hypothetical protein [Methylocaldum sp.]
MPIFNVSDLGAVGIVKDVPPHTLPPNAWSDGLNVRFFDDCAAKTTGYFQVFGDPDITPYGLFSLASDNKYNWIYAGLEKVYVFDGTDHINITRQETEVDVNYTGTVNDPWTGGILGGVPVLNNGVDAPQMWLPATTGTKLAELSNWPADTTCRVMRVFKSYLIALDVTKDGDRFPQMLKWSHPADPFAVPSSWDETDPTLDAGEYTFSDGSGFVIDCLPLGDNNIIYREDSVWAQQFIGGIDIFRFSKRFGTFGVLSPNCATEFLTGRHLVLAQGDIVVHDGISATSVLNKKWRRWLSANVDQAAVNKSFVVTNPNREEVWICIPVDGAEFPNFAIIWNYRSGAVGYKDIPEVSMISSGIVDPTIQEDWNDPEPWDSDTTAWGELLYKSSERGMLMASVGESKLYKADQSTENDTATQSSFLQRTGIGIPFKQGMPPDFTSYKFIRGIWPRIEGTLGGVVRIRVGTQNVINGPVTWGPYQNFTIGSNQRVDVLLSGRLLAIELASNTTIEWRWYGYELDVEFGGNF